MKKRTQDILVVGFALFAIFFGAGNLIFPPRIGVIAGTKWWQTMIGFLLTDPVLPILGVIVTATVGGKADDLGKRVSKNFSKILGAIAILTIGPFFSVPRTSATTHSILVAQIFPSIPLWLTSLVFFSITLFFVLNENGVMDKIGKYLTPGLLIIMTVIIVKSIISPVSTMAVTNPDNFFLIGFKEGYQTMDALGSMLMTGIVVTDLIRKGYKDEKEQFSIIIGVSIVAFILLAFVYGGLTYFGATTGKAFTPDTDKVEILIGAVTMLFGNAGKMIIGIAVALACMTTSVGLIATCGNFFENISKGKISYKKTVTVAVIISYFLSLLGVEGLVSLAGPILGAIYPVIIVLIVMTMFDKKIKYNATYTGAVVGAFLVSIPQLLSGLFGIGTNLVEMISKLPFNSVGFEWLLPALVTSIIFTLISKSRKKEKAL